MPFNNTNNKRNVIIASALGILILVAAVAAGVFLTSQKQIFQQKAATSNGYSCWYCYPKSGPAIPCDSTAGGTSQCNEIGPNACLNSAPDACLSNATTNNPGYNCAVTTCGGTSGGGGTGGGTVTPTPTASSSGGSCSGTCFTNIANCGVEGYDNGSGSCSNGGLCCQPKSSSGGSAPTQGALVYCQDKGQPAYPMPGISVVMQQSQDGSVPSFHLITGANGKVFFSSLSNNKDYGAHIGIPGQADNSFVPLYTQPGSIPVTNPFAAYPAYAKLKLPTGQSYANLTVGGWSSTLPSWNSPRWYWYCSTGCGRTQGNFVTGSYGFSYAFDIPTYASGKYNIIYRFTNCGTITTTTTANNTATSTSTNTTANSSTTNSTQSQSTSPSTTPSPECGTTCSTNSDCPAGLTCSGGACRNPNCSNDSTCSCASAAATPTATPALAQSESTPSATAMPIPVTGDETPIIAGGTVGIIMLIAGVALIL